MKQTIRLCTLMLLVANQPLYAALLGSDSTGGHSSPAPAPAQRSTPTAVKPVAPPSDSKPTQTIEGITIPKDLSKLSPAESKKLLEQAKNLNPEQLQAIAKSYQQGQQQTAEQPAVPSPALAPERKKSLEEMQRDQAFGTLIDEVLPMSPDQIVKIHKYYDLTLQARATPPNPTPIPAIRSETISTEPGSDIPVVRLSAGFVTSILFTDANCGSPWKLRSYSIGDPGTFNIQWDHKGNTIFIQSLKPYAHGNLAIQLWGLDTPIMLTLVSGPRMLDSRVDFKVPGRNPDCEAPPIISGGISSVANVNSMLINILDGVPPRGSIKLHVAGGPGEAWLVDNKIFFRTKLTLLSPAWVSSVSSPDGTHVYELMLTPSILASENGKTIDIKLSGL
ncbi:MAG: DotH/IcmK family type IV secretion protein [Candidatus Berkiella sp.]